MLKNKLMLKSQVILLISLILSASVANSKAVNETSNDADTKYIVIKTKLAGTLSELIGDETVTADSLVVEGPINSKDFQSLWRTTFYGNVSVINLQKAVVINGIIPDYAFYNYKIQINPEEEYITTIKLRRIILPDGITKIGQSAFSYAIDLKTINFPATLQAIGEQAFVDCINLSINSLDFFDGFETIGDYAFYRCYSMTGKVTLPSTIKNIGEYSFVETKITSINFPEGLQTIGQSAFYASALKEIKLPGTLKNTNEHTFEMCRSLEKIELSEGIETIGTHSFQYATELTQIAFPSTLKSIGAESCSYWQHAKCIYCAAPEPPVCEIGENGSTPFGKSGDESEMSTQSNIPVYVPVGTADKYRNATGWNYFTNFIETDQFPDASLDNVTIDTNSKDATIYDLYGRKVINPQKGNIYIIDHKKVIY